jgi:SAM-dependent methyltransferase
MRPLVSAAERWAAELAAWAIDPDILAAAPESPYHLPPELFAARPAAGDTSPLLALARAALPPSGGQVLDVGSGAGAASLPLVPPAAGVVAVDSQPSMLDAIRAAAAERSVRLTTYEGSWLDVADDVPVCDVVVCSHVAYNVSDLGRFAVALHEHARHRVVVELLDRHPWADLAALWRHFHHQARPTGPTAELATEVLREVGLRPYTDGWSRPPNPAAVRRDAAYVAFTRRRLCLPAVRDPEVARLLAAHPARARESVVLWWDV